MWYSKDVMNDLIYWKNPRESGIAFGTVLVVLLAVKYISFISVVGNLALALVTSTMAFRIYKSVLSAINKTESSHPFKDYLDYDMTLPSDKVQELVQSIVSHLNVYLLRLKKIFFVEELIESIKFAVCMYLLTFIGAIFNILSLIILSWIGLFSLPRVYQDNQKQIDEAIAPLKLKIDELSAKIKGVVPGAATAKKEE